MAHSDLIAEVSNQQQTLTAVIEQNDRVAYFYLWPTEPFRSHFAVRGCWLRNLLPAPQYEDSAAIAQGIVPLLSAEYCRTLEAEPPLDPSGLHIIWAPSDDGAAVWYQGQLLAVIPGWSLYQDQQVSFSAGCIHENRLTAPLGSSSTNEYYAQAEQHRLFWRDWHDDHAWPALQRTLLQCYEAQYGQSLNYYAIDQGAWPPMSISQHYHQGVWYFLTLGMSIRPMPWVDFLYGAQAGQYRRAELAMAIDADAMAEGQAVHMASALAQLAPLPWRQLSWLGEGHSLTSAVAPVGFDGFILSAMLAEKTPGFTLPPREGDQVNLLWATPVMTAERQFALAEEQGGNQLVTRLLHNGVSAVFRPRHSVFEMDH